MANPDFLRLTRMYKEGSYNTQRSRKAHVKLIGRQQLGEAGFNKLGAKHLKPKHWPGARSSGGGVKVISAGTLKNRMGTCCRWVYEKVEQAFRGYRWR